MDERKLDDLLEELSQVEVQPSRGLVYKARQRAMDKAAIKEKRREWYPFVIIILLNVFLVVAEVVMMFYFVDSLKHIALMVGVGFFSMQLPIVAYLLGKIYYREKELERD